MNDEFRFHLEMETERLVREAGLSPQAARRRARVAFGGVETHKEALRDGRGLAWLTGMSLDLKMGCRMLVRYPILTLVGGLTMAFAIAAGAGTFEVIQRAINPALPLPDGERIVGFNYWDRVGSRQAFPTPYDYLTWREGLRSVHDLGGFRTRERNLAWGEERGAPVRVAEISAAAFVVASVPPVLGRTLVEADEQVGAPAVAVLGHGLWETRFGRDRAVLGQIVRLGDTRATVVGVMPEGFLFPAAHNLWTPLRPGDLARQPGEGVVQVFGRLAPGVNLAEAQAELTTLVARAADQFPDTYAELIPHVLPYAESFMGIPPDVFVRAGIYSVNVFAALFLLLSCSNVALLMFARAATREKEILVRGALGAGRGRIVMQLFAEALVLGALAALLGLTATNYGLLWFGDAMTSESDPWPFWLTGGLSPTTLTYAVLLTVVAAAVAGVLPGLKVTRRGWGARLREAAAGAGGLQMGGIWTGVIIAQIAATVLFTGVAYVIQIQASRLASTQTAFPAEEYLAVRLDMNRGDPTEAGADADENSFLQNYSTIVRELKRQLALEPSVAAVTLAERLPLMEDTGRRIEVDDAEAGESPSDVGTAAMDLDAFEVFQTPVRAGRGFESRDLEEGANTVVVNRLFVDTVLAGRSAIGRRIRYTTEDSRSRANPEPQPGPWLEIVGVVPDLVLDPQLPINADNPAKPIVYSPLGRRQEQIYPLYLAAHVRGDPASLTPALRRVAGDLSPTLRLSDIQALDQANSRTARLVGAIAYAVLLVSVLALFLSLAGIYSVISFTVSRRTRDIAIRVALGAQSPRVIADTLGRPLSHVAAGVAAGCVLMGCLVALSAIDAHKDLMGAVMKNVPLLLGYGITMLAVCVLACSGPILRALRLEPTRALREDA
jgi:predicted permease